jgi:hypothetical protein
LPLVRGAWVVVALLMLANFVASIPAYYHLMNTVCPQQAQIDCNGGFAQLSADSVQALKHLHLSLPAYAVYFLTLDVVVSLLSWGIGLVLFWRKSDEGMGLFVSLLFVLFGGNGAGNTLSGISAPNPHPLLVVFALQVLSAAQWIGLGAFLLTFPTGRFAPRWSLIILSLWILTFLQGFFPPFPGSTDILSVVSAVEGVAVFGGSVFIVIYRYRRIFDAAQRQQTKWVVYAAAVWVILYLLGTALPSVFPAQSPFQLLFPTLTIMLSSALLYLSLGFAMLRYRLWDIDAIINRTLVYGSLTAILTLLYVGVIVGLQALTQAVSGQGQDNPLVIVGSTLLIIALFNPLRRRIQTFIDRRFYRQKYDAVKILAAFSSSLRTEVDLADLRGHLISVITETMQPTQVSLWLRSPQPGRKPEALPRRLDERSEEQMLA